MHGHSVCLLIKIGKKGAEMAVVIKKRKEKGKPKI